VHVQGILYIIERLERIAKNNTTTISITQTMARYPQRIRRSDNNNNNNNNKTQDDSIFLQSTILLPVMTTMLMQKKQYLISIRIML
jgi:hypothetical protein